MAIQTRVRAYFTVVLICINPICISFFENNLFWSLNHFLIFLLFFGYQVVISLYILEINFLLDEQLANIFSHSTGCLYPVDCFRCCARLFSLIESHLSISAFVAGLGDSYAKNLCPNQHPEEFSLYLLPVVSVSSLTCKSLIHQSGLLYLVTEA